jgi:hypothetical protein
MSSENKSQTETASAKAQNPNDPRRDRSILLYNREIFQAKDEGSGGDLY